jgi:PRC-barrel domain protein
VDHPYPWLRYLAADNLDDHDVDFDGMNVESPSGEHLGDVEGFIVDPESGRPYYVVVDAGGWFKSKHFLLPVGHAFIDQGNEVLTADVSREHVEHFPGFDLDEFEKLTPDALKRLNDATLTACSVSGAVYVVRETDPYSAAWDHPDFEFPDWWRPTHPGARPAERSERQGFVSTTASGRSERERRNAVVAHGDSSPHFDGRAQPGDVVGIETGGETTRLGDTGEDEDRRREAAERAARRD